MEPGKEGICYLRYDDTNPVAEEKEYFDSILESVRWLGFEPVLQLFIQIDDF